MDDIMKKSMVIYLLTDTTNGMRYVGQTINKLGKRMGQHYFNKIAYVDRKIGAHGWDKCIIEVLEECKTPEELNEREIFWIAKLNTKHPNGYNLTDGGEGNSGYKASEQSRRKMSLAHNPRPVLCIDTGMVFESLKAAAKWANLSPITIKRACTGESRTAAGLRWQFADEPLRPELPIKTKKNYVKRAVRCIELNLVFESVKSAAAWAGITASIITQVCRKKEKTAGGWHWEYCDESLSAKIKHKRAVRCIETERVFESIAEAADWAGIGRTSIFKVCNGIYKTAGGYHWAYVD